TYCRTFRELGRRLLNDPALVWGQPGASLSFFNGEIGVEIVQTEKLQGVGDRIEELNTDGQRFACRFIANHVPRLQEDQKLRLQRLCKDEDLNELEDGGVLPLSAIAAGAIREDGQDVVGVDYLGVLKGDVDFLGQIFSRGLGEDLSVSRYAT